MRRELSRKGRALLVAGTLCLSLGGVGWNFVGHGAGPAPDLAHFALGLLFGLGLTLNIGAWFVGRAPSES